MSVFFIPWAILPAEIFIYGECISVLVWRYLAEVNTGKKKQQKNRNKNLCKQQEHKYFWKRCCKWNSVANKASPKLEFLQAENSEGKFLFHSVLFPYSNITVIIFFLTDEIIFSETVMERRVFILRVWWGKLAQSFTCDLFFWPVRIICIWDWLL